MTSHHAAPSARERQRFLRPDFARYLKPDWRDRKYWRVPPPDWAEHPDDAHFAQSAGCSPHERSEMRETHVETAAPHIAPLMRATGHILEHELEALRREQAEIKRLLDEVKLDLLLRRVVRKYRPDQPRVPAGNPDGGQWTTEGESSAAENEEDGEGTSQELTDFSAARKAKGHHYVSQSVYRDLPLRPETRKVFDDAITGPLRAERHGWSREHDQYNQAVREHLNRFMEKHNVSPEQITPDQARAFVQEIKTSKDPRIRDFNLRILRREVLYWIRRGPRGRE